jgi:acetyltransferase-like isoleucine patch superfamily enzyme
MKISSFISAIRYRFSSVDKSTPLERLKQDNLSIDNTLHIQEPYSLNINGHINVGYNVLFRSFCSILVYPESKLTIKKNVFFNNYCSINCLGEILIEENTLFGEGVKLYDHNHSYKFQQGILKVERDNFKIGYVHIGKNCWIGSNVTILANVTIGDNVIIGANNLIYKSIPSNVVVKAKHDITIKEYGK